MQEENQNSTIIQTQKYNPFCQNHQYPSQQNKFKQQISMTHYHKNQPFTDFFKLNQIQPLTINRESSKSIIMQTRNRRFKKLKELRETNFFSAEAIKLRHPLLYYLFIEQYQFNEQPQRNAQQSLDEQFRPHLMSSFLQKHLINLQYKDLLNKQMPASLKRALQIQKDINEEQISQIKRIYSEKGNTCKKTNPFFQQIPPKVQIQLETEPHNPADQTINLSENFQSHQPSEPQIDQVKSRNFYLQLDGQDQHFLNPTKVCQLYEKTHNVRKLNSEERSLQEQHLIEYCEQLFLQGRLQGLADINYNQIDQNSEYDDLNEQNKDMEEKYFSQIQSQISIGNQNYYTGVQDY